MALVKGRSVILGSYAGREAAALMVDGVLDDLLIAPPNRRPAPGAIFRAVADRPVKGQGGLFLRLPEGTAFLRQIRGISPGQRLLVQVTGFVEVGKAEPVTNRILFKGRFGIVTPGAEGRNVSRQIVDEAERLRLREIAERVPLPLGAGLIVRSGAEGATDDEVSDEFAQLAGLATAILADVDGEPELLLEGPGPHDLAWRDWTAETWDDAPDAFENNGVTDLVDGLLRPTVPLSGGGRMTIEPTRALVAVDVDTGADTTPAAALKTNIAAARMLPRQLRCRGLGGQVTIDFAPMPKRDRVRLEQVLAAAFRADPVETSIAGWTPLSHMELQRKRERLPLTEALR